MYKPKCLVLGHLFVRRLAEDVDNHFDKRATSGFGLSELITRSIGVGGRTIFKTRQHDLSTVRYFGSDIVLLELGQTTLASQTVNQKLWDHSLRSL